MAKKKIDWILLSCVLLLIILGLLMVFGISAPFSQESFGYTYYSLGHQIIFGILPGTIGAFLAFKVKIADLKKIALWLFLTNLVLLFLVFLPKIGFGNNETEKLGANRWIKIGSFSFQPSEFLKISFFLYLAAWLESKKNDKKKKMAVAGFFLAILAPISLALILQPDVSTLSLLIMIALMMYFLSETPILHTFLMGLIALTIIFILIYAAPYRMRRFLAFLMPELDPMGISYQIKQAQIAIGSGGIGGRGLGMSKQKFGFLPYPKSDSIFAVFGEETGFLGCFLLILLFFIFLVRGIDIAKKGENKFSRLLAYALTVQIVLQAFLHMSSMTGVLPLTGIPLPFISYGGTHLVVELISVGILLNISKQN